MNQDFEIGIDSGFNLEDDDLLAEQEIPLVPASRRITGLAPTWDKRLPLEVALGIDDLPTILLRYDITRERWDLLSEHPAFRRELAAHMKDLRENGYGFEQKCRVQAEEYLGELDRIVMSADSSDEVKLKAIQSVVKWAKLDTGEADDKKNNNANMVQININI